MYNKRPTYSAKKPPERGSQWERTELLRLLCALVLFLTVFLGKQIYPDRVLAIGEEIVSVLGQTTDFQAVFLQLGNSLQGAEETLNGIEQFCIEVFGPKNAPTEKATAQAPILPALSSGQSYYKTQRATLHTSIALDAPPPEPVVPAVGTVLTRAAPSSQSLPDGYTADKLSFGSLETVNPVLGQLNSGFGYRDHPVNGKYCFHGGADISANAGDPIAAFADGQVEYVGEDDSYGLYLQLDHGNGIKSFYAHCQSLCVTKGQQIKIGETIAKVGSTGRATGPHLHLELKCGGLRVDPAYYIDFISVV